MRGDAKNLVVAVAQQCGQAGKAWVDLLAAMDMVPGIPPSSALDTEAGAVWPAERVHRLGQCQLIMEDSTQLDLVVLVDSEAHFPVFGLENDGLPGVGVDARQKLLIHVDADLFHVRIGAARAAAAEWSPNASAEEDAAVRAQQAQIGIERTGKLDIRAERHVPVPKPNVAQRARRLAKEPRDVVRDHCRVVARTCSSASTPIAPASDLPSWPDGR